VDETTTPRNRRTSGSETRQRQATLRLRVTAQEKGSVEARAEKAGLTVAGYLRALVFGKDAQQPRAARRPPLEKQELIALRYELRKIGGNLNQIAHHLNQGQAHDPQNRAQLAAALAEHRAALAAILAALGKDAPAAGAETPLAAKLFGKGRAA
jgi:hypothetical protein